MNNNEIKTKGHSCELLSDEDAEKLNEMWEEMV